MTVGLIPYAGKEEKSTRRGGPRTPRETLQRNDRITADILGKLMPDVIEPRLKMPAKEALENLASILESWRGYYWRHDHIDQLENKVALAADELVSGLKELREICGVPRKIGTIDQVSEAIDRLFNEGVAVEHSGKLTWHWLANVLPVDFATAIKTTNPRYKIGIGHTGPLVRFIVAIVPLLTGEHPTPGTIAVQLKNYKTKHLRGKQFGDRIPPP